jgi:hypothetical protein
MSDSVASAWDSVSLSKINLSTFDSQNISCLVDVFDAETKWYASTLSALLCQQGFIFDCLDQNENAKMCFEAAMRMLPLRGQDDTCEPFLKNILRNRVLTSRKSSEMQGVPDTFEKIPDLQKSFIEHSLASASSIESQGARFMNISGWMSFCAKYRFHVFFPPLIRSKCIGCFMESAKKSHGNTLLLSFTDFCSSLLLLGEAAGTCKHSNEVVSEEARVAAVFEFLHAVDFFILHKQPQRRQHKLFSVNEETGHLTTNIVLPILRSVVENESQTWSSNSREIVVDGVESYDVETQNQCFQIRFRAPFDFYVRTSTHLLLSTLALSAVQVSAVAFSCSSLKLNKPLLAQHGCLHALQFLDFHPRAQEVISCRLTQILAIAMIHEALCCSNPHKAKDLFSKYHREMRNISDDTKNQHRIFEHTRYSKSKCISSCGGPVGNVTTCNKTSFQERESVKLRNVSSGGDINRTNQASSSKRMQAKEMSVAESQLSLVLPDLPLKIIRFDDLHLHEKL